MKTNKRFVMLTFCIKCCKIVCYCNITLKEKRENSQPNYSQKQNPTVTTPTTEYGNIFTTFDFFFFFNFTKLHLNC